MNLDQLETEFQNLQKDMESRERRISAYEKSGVLPGEMNFAYVFNFDFGPIPDQAKPPVLTVFPLQQRTVQVKKDTIFYVKSFTQAYTITGTRDDPGAQPARLTLPRTIVPIVFRYDFKISDTGSDMEWQNDWVPGDVLLTGNYNGFRLRRGHRLCSPGAEVNIQVQASTYGNLSEITGIKDVTKQELQIVMAGFEVAYKENT